MSTPPTLESRIKRLQEIEPLTESLHTLVQGTLAMHADPNRTASVTEFMAAETEQKLNQLAAQSEYAANLERIARAGSEAHARRGLLYTTLRSATQAAHTQQAGVLEQLTHLAQRLPTAEQTTLLDLIRISQAAQDQFTQALNSDTNH